MLTELARERMCNGEDEDLRVLASPRSQRLPCTAVVQGSLRGKAWCSRETGPTAIQITRLRSRHSKCFWYVKQKCQRELKHPVGSEMEEATTEERVSGLELR